jgi:hypothetical protein
MRVLLLTAIVFFGSLDIFSQVPGTLSYQGILLQSDGITPLTDGAHSIVFSFYTVSSGGSALFTRTISVTTSRGLYTCIIGGGVAPNAPFNATEMNQVGSQQVYFGIKVDAGTELLPRAQLTTAAYTYQAQSAYSISDNAVTSAKIVDGAITNADINSSAAIVDTKLAPITTAGKVSGNAITSGTIGGSTSINTTGTITIPSSNQYAYASAKTHYLSISNAAFQISTNSSGGSAFVNRILNNGGSNALTVSNGLAFAAVYLPDGATITSIDLSVYSDPSFGGPMTLRLMRQANGTASGQATVATVSAAALSVNSTSTTTAITNGTIDNANYNYQLVLEVTSAFASLYNARITYTTTKTD